MLNRAGNESCLPLSHGVVDRNACIFIEDFHTEYLRSGHGASYSLAAPRVISKVRIGSLIQGVAVSAHSPIEFIVRLPSWSIAALTRGLASRPIRS